MDGGKIAAVLVHIFSVEAKMDISQIKEHMPVYADGPGSLSGASEELIGTVDKVEGGKYVKLTKHSAADEQHH